MSDAVEVMVMTIDSFNKTANVLRRSTDRLQGETPIHLIQAARPILILDEPQNMESEKSVAALALLDPLFALRYSATHRNPYNLVYRLTPAQAYQEGLVKKIEVASVMQEDDENLPYVRIEAIRTKKTQVSARVAVHKLMKDGTVKDKTVTVKAGDSLAEKANRSDYEPFQVDEINPGGEFVRFANNVELSLGEELGADKEAIFDAQIRYTVEEHFQKQARLKEHGIKVISLFFIDRVANYADEDGIIRRLFDQAFEELKAGHPEWEGLSAEEVQAAYFAEQRRRSGEVELLDSKTGEAQRDVEAYELIMKDKETLLSFPENVADEDARRKARVCFIFSHSALREGWDNPNVFQICTLNQTASAIKKRQEVGRGVRLGVDQEGSRLQDERVNILTVVANESYARYVQSLQDEIAYEYREAIEARYGKPIGDLTEAERRKVEDEYGEGILPPKPRRAGHGRAHLRKRRVLSDEFKALWERIKDKTRYAVGIDTDKLLDDALPNIERETISPPRVTITKAQMAVDGGGAFEALQTSAAKTVKDLAGRYPLPNLVDVMSNLLENTTPPVRLTRRTLLEVFRRAGNKQAALDNPHEWASVAVRVLKDKLMDQLVDGIRYEKLNEWYEMQQILDDEVVEVFSRYVAKPDVDQDKTVYDLIPCDSDVEKEFVKGLEAREDVKLYVKLPGWFTVPTPVGDYNPDWAIVMDGREEDGKPVLYLVSETKGEDWRTGLRPSELRKIKCGAAHFGSAQLGKKGALDEVDFKVVSAAAELP
jgi:type III restriction enzyme